jgi:signal transduction histidine kinase
MPLPARLDEIRDLANSINEMAARLARLQDTVRRAERLRLLGQVSGGLAHQLRNGLTGARLALQLFAGDLPPDMDAAPLDVALRQLTLLESNLKRFLDLGGGGSRRERCDMSVLVAEAVELLRPQCQHARIDLCCRLPAESATVSGDPGQLGQLVLNVLGNAVEAAGPKGRVEVNLAHRERVTDKPSANDNSQLATINVDPVGESTNGARRNLRSDQSIQPSTENGDRYGPAEIFLEISDSGPGPPAEIAERLFEPFVTGKPEGVGLGLAVARQVVEAHGGTITWSRETNRTCFRICIPNYFVDTASNGALEPTHP